jgi:flagellar biogenesis protein FliO
MQTFFQLLTINSKTMSIFGWITLILLLIGIGIWAVLRFAIRTGKKAGKAASDRVRQYRDQKAEK